MRKIILCYEHSSYKNLYFRKTYKTYEVVASMNENDFETSMIKFIEDIVKKLIDQHDDMCVGSYQQSLMGTNIYRTYRGIVEAYVETTPNSNVYYRYLVSRDSYFVVRLCYSTSGKFYFDHGTMIEIKNNTNG